MYTPTSIAVRAFVSRSSSCKIAMLSGGLSMPARGCFRDACTWEKRLVSSDAAYYRLAARLWDRK